MKKRGRPTVSPDEPSTPVSIAIPISLYDRAYAVAIEDRITIPQLIRRAILRDLQTKNRPA